MGPRLDRRSLRAHQRVWLLMLPWIDFDLARTTARSLIPTGPVSLDTTPQ